MNETLIAAAPPVMSEMIKRAMEKHRTWQLAHPDTKFSNELWNAKLQEFMSEALTEFEHPFESREQLSRAHTLGLEKLSEEIRAKLGLGPQ